MDDQVVDIYSRRLRFAVGGVEGATPSGLQPALERLSTWLRGCACFDAVLSQTGCGVSRALVELTAHVQKHQQNALQTGFSFTRDLLDEVVLGLAILRVASGEYTPPRVPALRQGSEGTYSLLQIQFLLSGGVTRDGKSPEGMAQLVKKRIARLAEYLRNTLQDQGVLPLLLRRYKRRTEIFRAELLRQTVLTASGKAEDALAPDLYTFLIDQGLDFEIQPSSAGGYPDLVTVGHDRGEVLDLKYVSGVAVAQARKQLVNGTRQVLDYCANNSSKVGRLVVYVNADLRFNMPQAYGVDAFVLSGTTVYFYFLDIFDHRKPPSQRPAPTVVAVSEKQLAKD